MESNKKAEPLLKWPGGKRRVLSEIEKYVPMEHNKYYEPFLGGGAVFFNLAPQEAHISDYNEELINFYKQIKLNPKKLISELESGKYVNNLETFLAIRMLDRDDKIFQSLSEIERAARFNYLNRTCFNGLYRVNSKNQFNVPFGKYSNPKIVDSKNIYAVSNLLNETNIILSSGDYSLSLSQIKGSGNFIYLDPPYIPLTKTASFGSYTASGFSSEKQRELRDLAKKLDISENYVLLSNSDTEETRELYSDFHIVPINVKRSIGASASTRVAVGEILVLGKTLAKKLNIT